MTQDKLNMITPWFGQDVDKPLKPGYIVLYEQLPYVILERYSQVNIDSKVEVDTKINVPNDHYSNYYYKMKSLVGGQYNIKTIKSPRIYPFKKRTPECFWDGIEKVFTVGMI